MYVRVRHSNSGRFDNFCATFFFKDTLEISYSRAIPNLDYTLSVCRLI